MRTRSWRISCMVLIMLLVSTVLIYADEFGLIQLPKPAVEGGKPLMEVLKARQTGRDFSAEKLPMNVISDMLWAAFGVNRPESGKRTAPSAMNMQEIDIYVALERGLYLYNAEKHTLDPVLEADLRADTGPQPFVKDAPVNLVYVADLTKMARISEEQQDFYSACDTGFISQNVYLYCASEGLATVVRGYVDKEALARAMGLSDNQKIVLAQTVGYPKETQKESTAEPEKAD